jgi:hypothetical protein
VNERSFIVKSIGFLFVIVLVLALVIDFLGLDYDYEHEHDYEPGIRSRKGEVPEGRVELPTKGL